MDTSSGPSTPTVRPQEPFWVLSLDGGGVRGYSSLIILAEILKLSGRNSDVFAVTLGTSAGGLSALMVGRLGLHPSTWNEKFRDLSTQVFQTSIRHYLSRIFKQRYSAGKMKKEIKKIIEAAPNTQDVDPNMQIPVQTQTYVVCREVDTKGRLIPGHIALGTRDGHGPNCMVWEAGRATSAAPTYFERQCIEDRKFVDGGLGYNNPIITIHDELEILGFQGRDKNHIHYISIGTGKPDQSGHQKMRQFWRPDSLKRTFIKLFLGYLKLKYRGEYIHKFLADKKAREVILELDLADNAHHAFQARINAEQVGLPNMGQRYFRFNCTGASHPYSVADTKLDQVKDLDRIAGATRTYLDNSSLGRDIDRCVALLRAGNERFLP